MAIGIAIIILGVVVLARWHIFFHVLSRHRQRRIHLPQFITNLAQHEQHVWFIMNSDGSQNITADIQIAFKSPVFMVLPMILPPIGIILLIIDVLLLRRKRYVHRHKKTTHRTTDHGSALRLLHRLRAITKQVPGTLVLLKDDFLSKNDIPQTKFSPIRQKLQRRPYPLLVQFITCAIEMVLF